MTTTRKRRKRATEDGVAMSRVRKVVDNDTGETYRVETTREAKRRYQRNGGVQFKPTIGQINAADIWNKQEEKIKRDREREEKRKKAKLRQEAKDARQREVQQEELREGRISIEDTWGKVSASQNRLHTFFGPPKKPQANALPQFESTHNVQADRILEVNFVGEGEAPGYSSPQNDFLQDLDKIFTTSPLSPDARRMSASHSPPSCTQATERLVDHRAQSCISPTIPSVQTNPLPSQVMMPPPKRAQKPSPTTKHTQILQNASSNMATGRSSTTRPRQPLSELTMSEMNARANVKPDLVASVSDQHNFCPSSTQVVRDTLSGLCSQDFHDDLSDGEKENQTPSKLCSASGREQANETYILFGDHNSKDCQTQSLAQTDGRDDDDNFDDCESETFDDGDIDDEVLLSLAATQQLKQQLFAGSRRAAGAGIQPIPQTSESKNTLASNIHFEEPQHTSYAPKLGDSFAMDGLNDDDLLEGLEDYENQDPEQHTNSQTCPNSEEAPSKKRRILPWIKDPISFSFNDCDDRDAVTPSPLSQPVDA